MDNRDVEVHAFRLFEASGFGSASTEHSMWVILKNGQYSFVVWPWSAEPGKERWNGPIPDGLVATVHTHPTKRSEYPSDKDHDLADGKQRSDVRIPVYVLHRNGIWKAVPGVKKPVQVCDFHWLNAFKPK